MTQSTEFAAFVGLDWDDEQHAVCILPAAGGAAQHGEVKQHPEDLAAWVAELRARYGGRPVAVCLEQSRGALVYALMQYDFLVLHPLNPKQLSDYRGALYPSGAKTDQASILADTASAIDTAIDRILKGHDQESGLLAKGYETFLTE